MTGHITEVVISGWTNTLSCIRRGVQGEWYTSSYTPDLLHCSEFRTFWISWAHGHIRVGRGPIPGEQTFMDAPGTYPIASVIRGAGFSTGFGHTGVWKIEENQGYFLGLRTPDDFRYQFMWRSVEHKSEFISFFVSACHDAHINLSPEMGKIHYEIVIGGWENTRSVIRINNGRWLAEQQEVGLLDCSEMRTFWISWYGGVVRVGKGDIHNKEKFMEFTDHNAVPIRYYTVASGFGATATWLFNNDLENRFRYFTTSENKTFPDFDFFALTPSEEFITFEVTACSDFMMAISNLPGEVGDFSKLIFIGSNSNTKSGLYEGFSSVPSVSVDTPGILRCRGPRNLWMSWGDNVLKVGRGNVEGFAELFRYNLTMQSAGGDGGETMPYQINSVGFGNNHQKGGQVKVDKNAGSAQIIRVRGGTGNDNAWVSVVDDFHVTFAVRACRDAHIALSAIEGVLTEETYEVILGLNGYKTAIAEKVGSMEYISQVETPEILSCTQYRYFWLSWLDGYIRIGRGEKYGMQEILSILQPKPHPVNALALYTTGAQAYFEFEADREDFTLMKLPSNDIGMKWFAFSAYSVINWVYLGVRDGPVRIALSDRYMDAYNAYHVYLGMERNTVHKLFRGDREVASTVDPNLLNPTERTQIWISWEGGQVMAGRSKFRGVMPFLQFKDNNPIIVRAMSASGIDDSVPEIKVWRRGVSEISYDTSGARSFEQMQISVRHRTHLKFELDACEKAEVTMCSYLYSNGERFCYRVLIQGQNNVTSVNRVHFGTQHQMLNVTKPGLLQCGEWRRFWLSWHGGHIALGTGQDLGQNGVIAYQDLNAYPIQAFAISTDGKPGKWRFARERDFEEIPQAAHKAINGAQIAGIVVGALVLVILFTCLVDAVNKPPVHLEKYLVEPEKRTGGKVPQSFENPLAGSYSDRT